MTNGRAPFIEDPTDGKAFGARGHVAFNGEKTVLKLGLSGYFGDSLETQKALAINPGGVTLNVDTKYKYQEWGLGADVSLDWGGFRLRTEGLVHRVRYEDGRHEPVAFAAPGLTHPSRYDYYWYAILAYRFGAFEPYTYTEIKYSTPRDGAQDLTFLPGLGLNIYFSPYAQLKTQYVATKFYQVADGGDVSDKNFQLIDSRFVLSF